MRARAQQIGVGLAGLGFALWAGVFIYRTSFVALHGERVFCLFDDAMISMRYAWNLAHGNGLAWNPGERVEGITNLLMTLWMAVPTGLLDKSDAVLAVQISGVAFLLAVAWVTMRIGEALVAGTGLAARAWPSVLFFACALAYYPLDFWTLMGMETGLLTLLLLAAVWIAFRIDGRAAPSPLLAVLLGLAFATRPDAAVPIALVLLYRLYGLLRPERRPGWLRGLALESAIVAAFVAAVTAFRWLYYGSVTPNTYTLKVEGMPLALRLANGLDFTASFARSLALPLGVALLVLLLRRERKTALIVALVLSSMAYQVWVGGDAWPYWRINAPFVPPLFAVVIGGLGLGLHRLGRRLLPRAHRGARWLPALEGALLVVLLLPLVQRANASFEDEMLLREPAYFVTYNWRNVNTSIALSELVGPEATVGVFWGGTIPYYTGLRGVDFLGKSDPRIAALPPDTEGRFAAIPGHNKYDLHYSIVELRPTYVQSVQWGRQNVGRFVREHYRGVRYKGVRLLLAKDSPHVDWDKVRAAARAERERAESRRERSRQPQSP